MSDSPVPQGRSFVAELYCLTSGREGPIGVSTELYRDGPAQENWVLVRNHDQATMPCRFIFDYALEQDGRAHYAVYGQRGSSLDKDQHVGRLEISRNGYLGFYLKSTTWQRWTLEVGEALSDGWYQANLASADGVAPRVMQERRSNFASNGMDLYLNTQQGLPPSLAVRVLHVYS